MKISANTLEFTDPQQRPTSGCRGFDDDDLTHTTLFPGAHVDSAWRQVGGSGVGTAAEKQESNTAEYIQFIVFGSTLVMCGHAASRLRPSFEGFGQHLTTEAMFHTFPIAQ